MPTNFEFIEINDAAAVPRKVAGDLEVQGADTIFHQTARNLNTRLEEATGVTLSVTPTVIALNGMESHVLLDIGAQVANELYISLQYVTGGDYYAADWQNLAPIVLKGSRHDAWTTAPRGAAAAYPAAYDVDNNQSGGHVFAIPTNGAINCRITLSAGSIVDVAWARVVLASPPYQNSITKAPNTVESKSVTFTTVSQPYVENEWLGGFADVTPYFQTGIESGMRYVLKDILILGETAPLPDFDLVIGSSWTTPVDGASWNGGDVYDVFGIFQFREFPAQGQFPIIRAGTGTGTVAQARGVNLDGFNSLYASSGAQQITAGILAKGPYATNGFFRCYLNWDAG